MSNREKVIKGLTAIQDEAYDRWVHRQYIEDPLITLVRDNIPDALDLLREQEPVKPKWFLKDPFFRCGACGKELPDSQFKFCPWCGREVKWDA